MADKTPGEIIKDGLWNNNPALVQVLGLCPLLAVTSTVVNAIGLGLATLLVLMGSNLAVSLIRNFVGESVRLPAFVMIIASFVTCAELLMQAFTYELYQILGIFIPLIVTNCAILGRADAFASRNAPGRALLDGAMMGLGFLAVLIVLGGMRELIGQGTLFVDMNLLLGPMAADWVVRPFEAYPNMLFMMLPPGAFMGLGLLIALKNSIDSKLEARRRVATPAPASSGSKRVRVTGNVS
ncbi:MAG: electron transport complex subunit E [Gammaproteobacteria bacterium]|uniref:Ion-translocating oxidoreductase complex subunit E n=1 Tax=Marinobacter nitratireducens TaxID=1137280 RepID=A0A072N4Y0_9GAMM|nr:electron transport complex subunit E [Marinobacter nitratireducens]KEF32769.1 Electron transport complex protein RnfE [Marinobacter nitratireducens]TNE72743.1 MAG: electron transport complex subunit E [Gammaproteobacteria bacterium]TNE97103.1 MAG: electron transport complex subunit E [Gammaproteobacteria bacterium]